MDNRAFAYGGKHLENGRLYVPCEYELQEYKESQKDRRRDYER